MNKVLLALLVLGMSATSHAAVKFNFGRKGASIVQITGLTIKNGDVVVTTAKGEYTFLKRGLENTGVSPIELVDLFKKYSNSAETLEVFGGSYIQYDSVNIDSFDLKF